MFFPKIVYGTQYYRSPTPLPDEWEGDIAKMEEFGMDAFQIRINWRWNEKRENEYDFSDIDGLLELAHKNGRKVVMKFLLECAPQYIYDKYNGTRIGPRGEKIRGGSHGAFYGGWRPCFTNPDVQRRAKAFVERVAERYADNPDIILWNTWNEIRNKPFEDCFCPHCRKAFGNHLKERFGTIEKLNEFYGTAEDDFDTIALPSTPHGYWDTFEFKKFKGGKELYNYLKFVYDGIKKYDKRRPIMAHVGVTSAFQPSLDDVCDDHTVSKAVDFWGTSIPCDCAMDTHEKRMDFAMLMDAVRGVDENFFLHEIYPGLGMFCMPYDTPFDMSYKLYSAIAGGARGLIYWQYRAERIGYESDCAGLFRVDGSPRPVAFAAQSFAENLHKDMNYFAGAKVAKAQVAIVFDFNSSLISAIDDTIGADFSFEFKGYRFYYQRSHSGMYRLLQDADIAVDYIGVNDVEKFKDYKLLYFPYHTMLNPEMVPHLEKFIREGGAAICDEGFGLRTMNTWMQPYDIDCKPIMTARLFERRYINQDTISVNGKEISFTPAKTIYKVEDAETLLSFNDGSPALSEVKHGEGRVYLSGLPIGYSYHKYQSKELMSYIKTICTDQGVMQNQYSECLSDVTEKRMIGDGYEIIFLFNSSEAEKSFKFDDVISYGFTSGSFEGGKLCLPAKTMGYVIKKIDRNIK
ncbi:MAG: beta-galactosidase [Clostridia bacterium]|nr:beta-galactosidase [Clostridia bacterium]